MFSAKALFDNNNIDKKFTRAPAAVTKIDNNFVLFQIDEATREVGEAKDQLRRAMAACDNAEKRVKEQVLLVYIAGLYCVCYVIIVYLRLM